MNSFLLMLLEASVSLVLFYSIYLLWLRNDTFFHANRFYLLGSAIVSLIIPLLNIPFSTLKTQQITVNYLLQTVTVTAGHYEQNLLQTLNTWQWIAVIYSIGVIVSLILLVVKFVKLFQLLSGTQTVRLSNSNIKLVYIDTKVAPFSFLHRIYINPELYTGEQLQQIIAHESVHIKQLHSYECICYELLIVFFWFNPIAYKYRKSAKEIHEYLADKGAIKSGISEIGYQKLLFAEATGLPELQLANSFNYSLIKRRLKMLTKVRSNKVALSKLLFFIPVLIMVVMVFACGKDDVNVISNNEVELKNAQVDSISGDTIFFIVEEMPKYPGGELELQKFIAQNVNYPEIAKKNGDEGRVFVQFTVDSEGWVKNSKVVKGVSEELDSEALRVVSMQPQWTPGKQDGENVNVSFTVPINFQLN